MLTENPDHTTNSRYRRDGKQIPFLKRSSNAIGKGALVPNGGSSRGKE